ncbi:hypothetical protein CISIN_1g0381262mg, partial [Citrus sinensis]
RVIPGPQCSGTVRVRTGRDPETCSVVCKLLKEEDNEAWGVEPFDSDDADANR